MEIGSGGTTGVRLRGPLDLEVGEEDPTSGDDVDGDDVDIDGDDVDLGVLVSLPFSV